MWHLPEITDECESVEFVCLGKGKSCVSQGHYNSLGSHHSCGVFMSDGLFCWIRFLGKRLGLGYKQSDTGIDVWYAGNPVHMASCLFES